MNFKGPRETDDAKQVQEYASVTKYMTKINNLYTFSPNQPIKEAIDTIIEKRISGGPVLDDDGNLVGMLSEKDCLKILVEGAYHNMPMVQRTVEDYMTSDLKTIQADKDVLDAANLFLNSFVRRFPVLDGKVLVGQISRRDILKAAQDIKKTHW
ncbi:MAG: CBS domain-containing protein [Flammeovirgaceae bacterium]